MVYGYERVSTKGQARDGNSLEAQERLLREAGATKIFYESYTGTKKHRPELDKLLSIIGEGDTLVVTKLDRMARSAVDGCTIIETLLNKGVTVNILNLGTMDNSPTGKLIRTIFFAFAEFERDMIVQRTQEGKAIAQERADFVDGRPRIESPDFEKYYHKYSDGELTAKECAAELGMSRTTWFARCKEMRASV